MGVTHEQADGVVSAIEHFFCEKGTLKTSYLDRSYVFVMGFSIIMEFLP